jgi:tol-pal system-associated acyl-CoA thioesterase
MIVPLPESATFGVKVYYEDTDALGVVYYANYLRYLERGRSEWIALTGKPVEEWNREGRLFAVYRIKMTFLRPARLGDLCQVLTRYAGGSEYRKKLEQRIERGGETITEAEVEIVCLDRELQLQPFPPGMFPDPA